MNIKDCNEKPQPNNCSKRKKVNHSVTCMHKRKFSHLNVKSTMNTKTKSILDLTVVWNLTKSQGIQKQVSLKQALDASSVFSISHGVKYHCMPLTMQFHFQAKVKICPYFFLKWFYLCFIILIIFEMKNFFNPWLAIGVLSG